MYCIGHPEHSGHGLHHSMGLTKACITVATLSDSWGKYKRPRTSAPRRGVQTCPDSTSDACLACIMVHSQGFPVIAIAIGAPFASHQPGTSLNEPSDSARVQRAETRARRVTNFQQFFQRGGKSKPWAGTTQQRHSPHNAPTRGRQVHDGDMPSWQITEGSLSPSLHLSHFLSQNTTPLLLSFCKMRTIRTQKTCLANLKLAKREGCFRSLIGSFRWSWWL